MLQKSDAQMSWQEKEHDLLSKELYILEIKQVVN